MSCLYSVHWAYSRLGLSWVLFKRPRTQECNLGTIVQFSLFWTGTHKTLNKIKKTLWWRCLRWHHWRLSVRLPCVQQVRPPQRRGFGPPSSSEQQDELNVDLMLGWTPWRSDPRTPLPLQQRDAAVDVFEVNSFKWRPIDRSPLEPLMPV